MRHLMMWFYCLSLWKATAIVLAMTVPLVLLCKKAKRQWIAKIVLVLLLALWAAAALYQTIWSRTPGESHPIRWFPLQSYFDMLCSGNLELFRSNYMNVLLFYPAGAILAALLSGPKKHPILSVLGIVLLGLFSVKIEVAQYRLEIGWAEMDDIIHNTSGSIIGYGVFHRLDQHIISFSQNIHKYMDSAPPWSRINRR